MAHALRRQGSLWPVEFMNTKAATHTAIKHAKELVLLHTMRMLAPLKGLTVGQKVSLQITLEELGDRTGIRNRNTLSDMLDWLEEHGGLAPEYYEYEDGERLRRSGLYWLGTIILTKVPRPSLDGTKRLRYSKAKVKWRDVDLSKSRSITTDTSM